MALDNETNSMVIDSSVRDAALVMPDFDGMDDPSPDGSGQKELQQARAPNGQYLEKEKNHQQPADQTRRNYQPKDDEIAIGATGDEITDTSTPQEEWFELPPEKEGEKPTRIKADEVWAGYQLAQQLWNELHHAKHGAPPPIEYDHEIAKTIGVRGQLERVLQHQLALLQPQEPDIEMLNPQSNSYNPEAYYHHNRLAHQQVERINAVRRELEAIHQDQAREQEALSRARHQREKSKLMTIWPELWQPEMSNRVRQSLSDFYQLDPQTLSTVIDSRFYAMAKDALAYRNQIAAQRTAARVVRSKPKLVKGQARSSNQKQQQYAQAVRKLATDNSVESAAEALGALF